jgi:cytidylate kinase
MLSIITIRGLLGSGAPEVGREVADRFAADYIDREVIAGVAAQLSRREQDVIAKETPPETLLGRIADILAKIGGHGFGEGFGGAYLPAWEIPLDDTRYLQALKSVVTELAGCGESMVIMGRGSQFILKDHPGCLHVLVTAPLPVRIERVRRSLNIDRDAAQREIKRFDKSVQEFTKRHFRANLEDAGHYDLVISTARLSFKAAAGLVVEATFEDQDCCR